jgi:K+-sensing histidine kinase KdpD
VITAGGAGNQITASKRLRRVRWSLTALFTLTAALCVGTVAAIALVNDARTRDAALDVELSRQVDALSRVVYHVNGELRLEGLAGDALVGTTTALRVWERVDGHWEARYAREGTGSAEGPELALADEVRDVQYAVFGDGATPGGGSLRLGAAPIWSTTNQIVAVLVVAADPKPGQQAHAQFVRWTVWGCLAVLLLAAGAGHLLSFVGIRPAVRALEQQERFLAEAAHELRTPLTTLRLVAEAGARDPARASASADQVVGLVDRMAHLVTGLLARARVGNGSHRMEWLPLRLDQLVEEVVDGFPVRLDARPTVVRGDPVLLTQALRNLVDNAIRHGTGTEVRVSVAAGTVTVTDHGPGIPVEERERVFERDVTDGTGTGIGLAIVRWVADLHHGVARVVDCPHGGTTVELVLPEVL